MNPEITEEAVVKAIADDVRKFVADVERKKEVDETLGGANRLKGALQSAKTRIRNRIEELEAAIESGERIVRVVRPAAEDAELRDPKSRRDSLQSVYDNIFGTKRNEKRDGEPDTMLLEQIEQDKAKLLERIRTARR